MSLSFIDDCLPSSSTVFFFIKQHLKIRQLLCVFLNAVFTARWNAINQSLRCSVSLIIGDVVSQTVSESISLSAGQSMQLIRPVGVEEKLGNCPSNLNIIVRSVGHLIKLTVRFGRSICELVYQSVVIETVQSICLLIRALNNVRLFRQEK